MEMIVHRQAAAALPVAPTPGRNTLRKGVTVGRAVVMVVVAVTRRVVLEDLLVINPRLLAHRQKCHPTPTVADAVPGREAEAAVTAVR